MAGKLLFSGKTEKSKVYTLLVAGIIALILGFGLDLSFKPIIKKIATSSFILASGGWDLPALALFYFWIDTKNHRNNLLFFRVAGMNSIFIYLFFAMIGKRWLNRYIDSIFYGLLEIIDLPHILIGILSSLLIFILEWYLCWYLYKNKIFIKI